MQSIELKKDFSIGELSEAASVTTRTIRYYVAEGLLASPENRGRGATYNEEHLARLQLIRRLKEEYLPLQEIATLMRGLDRQAVSGLLEQKQRTSVAPRSSAKAYLKDLLEASASASDSGRLRARVAAVQPKVESEIPQGVEWRRLVVDEGVELHVREDRLEGSSKEKVRQLLQFAKQLFLTR